MARRVLSIWFPHLAAERMLRRRLAHDLDQPFVITAMQKSALRLVSLNKAAMQAGLGLGMSLSDARAQYPSLNTATEEARADQAFLITLGRRANRYTPYVALERPDGLILDISGCAHLFGGEAEMAADISVRMARAGLSTQIGIADAAAPARALARFTSDALTIAAPGETSAHISALPVAALEVSDDTQQGLMRLGLHSIADVRRQPRAPLVRRFGRELIQRLDALYGESQTPLAPQSFSAPYAVRMSLPEPIGLTSDVRAALDRLLERLCERLRSDQKGATRLRFSVRHLDGGGDSATLGLGRARRDVDRIAALFDRHIDKMNAGFGIDQVRLEALHVEPLAPEQIATNRQASGEDAHTDLIARLSNRIGFDRVTRFLPADSHIPERSFTIAPAAYSQPEAFQSVQTPRPILIFEPEAIDQKEVGTPPALFRWRGQSFETHGAIGPERIAPEWWWDDPQWRTGPRDYWRVQTAQGRRLWLFRIYKTGERALTRDWFVHGEFT